MRALDMMTANVRVVTPDESAVTVAGLMRDYDVGFIPVVSDRRSMRVVGVITDRDIAIRQVAECLGHDCTAGQIMTRDVLQTVEPDDDLETILRLMRVEKVRRLLVVASTGRLLGIISQGDLLLHAGVEHPIAVERVLATISEPLILHM